MAPLSEIAEGKKAAVGTYMEQIKLLVTLSSAFLFAPAGLVALLKDGKDIHLRSSEVLGFLVAEGFFILSVLAGYIAMATLAGAQHEGEYNVHRLATRISSLVQFFTYLAGLAVFADLSWLLIKPGS